MTTPIAPTLPDELRLQLAAYHALAQAGLALKERLAAARAAFEAEPAIQETLAYLRETEDSLKTTTDRLRDALIEHYRATGTKTFGDEAKGLGIRVSEETRLVDPDALRAWCLREAPALLMVNETLALAYHAHVHPLPGINTTEKITTLLPKA